MSARLSNRKAFAAVVFALGVGMLGTTLPTPLYDLYRTQFGFSELMVTVIFAVYAAGVIASLLFVGHVSDQVGRRRTLLAALALSALSAVIFLLAHGLALLMVGRVVSGLSASLFTGTAAATLVDLSPRGQRSRAAFAATVTNMGSLGLGALLAGVISQWLGAPLRTTYWVDLALLVPAAIAIGLIPEPIAHRTRPSFRPHLPSIAGEARESFVGAAKGVFAGFAVLGLLTAVTPAFLGEGLGITARAAIGLVVFALFAASTVGQAVLGRIPSGAHEVAGYACLIVGMGFLALGLASSSLPLFVLGVVGAGLGQGITFRTGLTAVNEASPPDRRAETASALFVVAYAGLALPVVGEGLLASVVGLRAAGLAFSGTVAAVCAILLLNLLRGHSARVTLAQAGLR